MLLVTSADVETGVWERETVHLASFGGATRGATHGFREVSFGGQYLPQNGKS